MKPADHGAASEFSDASFEEATRWFLRMRSEAAQVEDLLRLKDWLDESPENSIAYRQVTTMWSSFGELSSAPEIMLGRRDALSDARKVYLRRWSMPRRVPRYVAIAASILVVISGALAWVYSQRGVYATDLGERRMVTLEDGSLVTLDAKSRIRVQYTDSQRVIALERGQARFDVAKDPTRPFRVNAGDQTVIALGTQFNVELVAGNVLVSMIEGHVAITGITATPPRSQQSPSVSSNGEMASASAVPGSHMPDGSAGQVAALSPMVELRAGEGLRVRSNGQAVVLRKINVAHAMAWQSGKMYFDNEPLKRAAERMNRYSSVRISVDPSVEGVSVSGMFNAGDSGAFVEAISTYFPIEVHRSGSGSIELTARN
jgi:transmembrane sensor